MLKILFVSTIAATSIFNRPFMRWFKTQGWQVDYASGEEKAIPDCDNHYTIPMSRNPCSVTNFIAVKKMEDLLGKERYVIVHCHTPVASAVTRLAAQRFRKDGGMKVLYTAHGFHFYTGAPLLNWLMYYPVEKYLSKITDGIITINDEDYLRAKKNFSRNSVVYKINGMGVDLKRFIPMNDEKRAILRESMGYGQDEFLLIYVAELSKRKNQIYLLHQMEKIYVLIPSIRILFVGDDGGEYNHIVNYIQEHKLSKYVSCLGYKKNVEDYYSISDICFSSSIQEGLPINTIEGMATGLPILASNIRGTNSLIVNGRNGFLFDLHKPEQLVEFLFILFFNKLLRREIGNNNIHDAKKYSVKIAIGKMADIYKYIIAPPPPVID